MQPTVLSVLDPMSVLEAVDAFLDHVERMHSAGLGWGGLSIGVERVSGPGRADPAMALGAPGPATRAALVADQRELRRLLALAALQLRAHQTGRRLAESVAEGLYLARRERSVQAMRRRLHHEVRLRLRHSKRQTMHWIDATGSVDIRLDARGTFDDAGQADIRRFLDSFLAEQAEFASFGRSCLGRLVRTRRQLAASLARVDALILGGLSATSQGTDTGPLTLITLPTPPATPAAGKGSAEGTG